MGVTDSARIIFSFAVVSTLRYFIASFTAAQHYQIEKQREAWELKNCREGEIKEMVDLYVSQGLERTDADVAVRHLARDSTFFVDLMMKEELKLQEPSSIIHSCRLCAVYLLSLLIMGLTPLLARQVAEDQSWVSRSGTTPGLATWEVDGEMVTLTTCLVLLLLSLPVRGLLATDAWARKASLPSILTGKVFAFLSVVIVIRCALVAVTLLLPSYYVS